jgi:hypothetical protein
MKLEFIRNTMTSTGNARIGQVLDLPDQEAFDLVKNARCVPYVYQELVDRSIGLSEETKPIKRGRPKKNV